MRTLILQVESAEQAPPEDAGDEEEEDEEEEGEEANEYERQREERIRQNKARMAELDLPGAAASFLAAHGKPIKAAAPAAARGLASRRAKKRVRIALGPCLAWRSVVPGVRCDTHHMARVSASWSQRTRQLDNSPLE